MKEAARLRRPQLSSKLIIINADSATDVAATVHKITSRRLSLRSCRKDNLFCSHLFRAPRSDH